MTDIIGSLRLVLVSLLVCVVGYGAAILGVAQLATPETAAGSLVTRADGAIVGSRLLAQKFTSPAYFWPRPSAVDYNAAGAGGSNKSPTSPDLTARGADEVARHGASAERPLPAELAAASGGGLDPHLTEHAARYQAPRVAAARGLPLAEVEALIRTRAFAAGGARLTPKRLVNVLELNLALEGLPAAADGAPTAGSPAALE